MTRGRVILLVLAVLAIGSLWRAVSIEKEKRRIAEEYARAQHMIAELENDRTHLNSELASAKQTVEGQAADLSSMQNDLKQVQSRLDETVVELSSLQREHEQLREHDSSLVTQLSSVTEEKQQLEARLASLSELRVAIRDVKRRISEERWAAWREHIRQAKLADQERLASGNRGFVIRQGYPTLGAAPRLHVHVLEPESQ